MEVDVESTERHFESNDNNHQMFIHENAKPLYNFKTDLDNDKALTTMDKTNRMKEVFNQYKEVNDKGKQDEEKILSGRIKRDALRNPLEVESTKLSQDVPSMLSSIDKLALKLAANKKQHIKSNIKCSSSSNRYGGEIIGESPIETLENFSKVDSADHIDNIHMAQETCDMSKIIKEIYEKSLMRDKLLFDKYGKASIYSPVDIISSTKSASDNLTGTLNRDHIPSDTLDHNCPSYKTELNINSYMCEMKSEPLEAIVSKEYQIDKDQEPLNESVCPEKSLDDKYDYFSRNIEIFVTHGPPKIKPRKKKTIQLPVDPQTMSDSVDDLCVEEKEEYTKKGYAKPFGCDICHRMFSQIGHLNRHMRIHTGEKPFQCDICGKEFSQSGDKRRHERTHTTYRPYQCFICDKEFNQSGHLQRHLRIHSGHILYNNGEFDKELTRQKYKEDKVASADKTKYCPLCEKTFVKKYLLERHIRSHTGETPYKCEECGKGFTRKDRLYTHARIHSGEKPYCCKECGKGFNQSSHLKTHIRIHTGDKPYKCGICGKGFAQSHDRKKHERVHTGERPYVCPLCGKDFSDNSQLWKHARTHDEDQEEGTLFKCRSCDKEYEYSSQLIHHMKEHSREQAGSIQLPNIGNFDNDSEMEKVRLTAEALVKDTLDIRDSSVNTEQNQVIADDKYLNVINGKDGNEYKNAFENLPGNSSENEESEPDQKEDGNESLEPKWNGKMYIAENAPENG